MSLFSIINSGMNEIKHALKSHEQWIYMAILDIKLRYRRSIIGPWWVTISTSILIIMLGFLFSQIFGQKIDAYLPFFAVGFIVWNWIAAQVSDAAGGFLQFQGMIRQLKLPFPVFTLRLNMRQLIILAHNSIIIALVLLFIGQGLSWKSIIAIPSLILIQMNLSLLSIIIAIFCSRYQDMTQVISIFTQILFFFTPILWQVDILKNRMYLAEMNPIYHWIEIIRAPLLGQLPSLNNYLWSVATLIFLLLASTYFLDRYRSRIVYWL
jgi:ABC-type polysaccharide/polyol phosphate export permease